MDEGTVDQVLTVVELIPRGRVASYGDVAKVAGVGPRMVGAVLSRHGSDVPWWRVTNHLGEYPPDLLARALPHWADEGIELKPTGRGCRLNRHRVSVASLRAAFLAPD